MKNRGLTTTDLWNEFGSAMSPVPVLFDIAQEKYPFIRANQMGYGITPREGEGFAETWPAGEPGSPERPRPSQFPLDRPAIQVFKPDQFTMADIAGEAMHVDPYVQAKREQLTPTLDTAQQEILKKQLDYTMSKGMPEDARMKNAVDALMRGYVVGQWPEHALKQFNFTAEQTKMLDDLKKYTTTGK